MEPIQAPKVVEEKLKELAELGKKEPTEKRGPPERISGGSNGKEVDPVVTTGDIEALKKEQEQLADRLKKVEDDVRGIKDWLADLERKLHKYVPIWALWLVYALLGGVGLGFLFSNFVFKTVTWYAYLLGFGLALVILTVYAYYKYKYATVSRNK